ncbi:MAG: DUF5103 domain-containing protein [Prevotella sp.]|nr:DUF5103 domain-containing protein [Prevotella sp.]
MKKAIFFLSLVFICNLNICAQRNEILDKNIASLQVVANNDWLSLPIITLNSNDFVNISFDDLTHEYHRYCYKIEHCEADWQTSSALFESDYIDGFASGNTIDDVQESTNTVQLYTHYSISFPNNKCRPKISGNYRVTIYNENDEKHVVCRAYFMIVEPSMAVHLNVTTNTDIDINGKHQQVEMAVDYGNNIVSNPQTQIKTVVMQNSRWDNAVINAHPQYIKANGLQWIHCKDYIFDGGNEYRKFETLDVTHTTMGLESINWDGHNYHAWIWTDGPRPSYIYDKDANGAFLIRNSDNIDNDVNSDYIITHFRLKSPQTADPIYINGFFTNDRFLPQYEMKWNEKNQQYEGELLLKQGYYSYQYLMMKPEGKLKPVPSEGNFFQTENTYQALIYFKANGDRTDRLVGYTFGKWN